MEQIKKATQHAPASKMNKEVYEPASAVDVSYFMIFLVVRWVTLVVALGIFDQWMVLCHSMDEGWVVEALKSYLL